PSGYLSHGKQSFPGVRSQTEFGNEGIRARQDAMVFCSQAYLAFFLVLFTVYWAIPWQRARVWLLLVASFYFYASWNHWLALLIGVSTLIDYGLARGMDHFSAARIRKILLAISVIGNLGLLCYFK